MIITATTVFSQSSVWKISNENSVCYVGGTVHLLSEDNYPLPDEFDHAYSNSDVVVFEVDMAKMNDPEIMTEMLNKLTYSDGRSLESVLSAKNYKKLRDLFLEYSMPIESLKFYKPGLISSMLSMLQFQALGYTEIGVDQFYFNKALADNKKLLFLETVDEQIEIICNMGDGNENQFIQYLLSNYNKSLKTTSDKSSSKKRISDLENTKLYITNLINSWEKGESSFMNETIDEMKISDPDLFEELSVQRNKKWIEMIKTYCENDDVEFILFGALHLHGEEGILNMMEKEGYQIEQLIVRE